MSKRLYVAKTYQVELGTTAAFGNRHYEFYEALGALGAEPNYVDGDDDCPSEQFEITKEDYEDALKKLEKYIRRPDLLEDSDDISNVLEGMGMTADELLHIMQSYKNEAAIGDGWLHFMAA